MSSAVGVAVGARELAPSHLLVRERERQQSVPPRGQFPSSRRSGTRVTPAAVNNGLIKTPVFRIGICSDYYFINFFVFMQKHYIQSGI